MSGIFSLSSTISAERIRNANVLIVEDNPVNQMLILETFRSHNFIHLATAENGREALEILKTFVPDLIVLDLMMPDIDGFALCKEIRSQPVFDDTPILAQTAIGSVRDRLAIFDLGASDLITKPINPTELIARSRIHLEKRFILQDLQNYQMHMEKDLLDARSLQNMLMPDHHVVEEARKTYKVDIHSLFAPSFAVGGDFWGIRPLEEEHRLALFIGDFTGHGVASALNVFRLYALLDRISLDVLQNPQSCLMSLSRQLHRMLPTELFATMFYAILDTQGNTLSYCLAGFPPPILLHGDGVNKYSLLQGEGLPLSIVADPQYIIHSVTFNPGDSLVLYSDALIETPDDAGKYLDTEVIARRLSATKPEERSSEFILQSLMELFKDFTPRTVEDDLTLNIYTRINH